MYIYSQYFTMIYGLIYSICIYFTSDASSIFLFLYMLIIYLTELFFILFLTSLTTVHTYLAINNMTTWEFLSRSSITYLTKWPRKYGSPFSKGTQQNLKIYFNPPTKGKDIMMWEFPDALPTFEEGEVLIRSSPLTQYEQV